MRLFQGSRVIAGCAGRVKRCSKNPQVKSGRVTGCGGDITDRVESGHRRLSNVTGRAGLTLARSDPREGIRRPVKALVYLRSFYYKRVHYIQRGGHHQRHLSHPYPSPLGHPDPIPYLIIPHPVQGTPVIPTHPYATYTELLESYIKLALLPGRQEYEIKRNHGRCN